MRSLVEPECGAANPLVQWSSHFTQEKSMLQNGIEHDRLRDVSRHSNEQGLEDRMVNEFLVSRQPAVPQTFHMGALLHELQGAQTPPTSLVHSHPNVHDDARVKEWVSEFAPALQRPLEPRPLTPNWAEEFQHEPDAHARQWAEEFAPTEEEKWVSEFEQQKGAGLTSVAKEMVESIKDPDMQATEFMSFVQKLASGEVTIDADSAVAPGNSKEWAEEFAGQEGAGPNGGYWDRLEKEWQEASRDDHPWLSEYHGNSGEYSFQEDNPLKDVANPLEEGIKRLNEGDLPSAVLLFEAEVQRRPEGVQGWQLLGTTQADNEQEHAAIAALNRCLDLEPGNLPARMALAVSYTNESQQKKALIALKDWLKHNPKYSSLVPGPPIEGEEAFVPSFMTTEEHVAVRDLYLRAAQTAPDQIDADVQVGLGVLFNLSNEYDKAVDCFQTALDIHPQDAMLWNKLGATLANSNRSEEAVHSYRKALEILPGFTRSRYNLGISCINLGAHKEAVEHFLTALNLQRQAKGPQGSKSQMSDSIWSTLRLAVTFLGRPELYRLVEERQLDTLLQEFGV